MRVSLRSRCIPYGLNKMELGALSICSGLLLNAALETVLAPLVHVVMQILSSGSVHVRRLNNASSTYLGQSNVGDNNDVQSRRRILLDARVTTGVVLVGALSARRLPRLAVLSLGHGPLRRGAGGRTRWGRKSARDGTANGKRGGGLTKVPTCKTEDTAHNSHEYL